jgi:RNA polymerase sigma factor (sigma-70 family)
MSGAMRTTLENDDARLVELSRDGNRDAFARIVERYQALVCALTYSASGNVQSSEDLAQVTFITAWCQLKQLREPAKLKAWLCRIARNVATDSHRQEQRTPTANAEELDTNLSTPGTPRDHVISAEEQAILWRVLEGLPETYREPLVLFYRQEQSISEVAEVMELSEDAVKQRLSRGRELLSERTAKFVETALHTSGPGKAFTIAVLATLPVLTTSAKAAVIGAAAAKGSVAAKAAAATGLLNAVLGPFLVIFGNYIGYRMNFDQARTDAERDYIKTFYRRLMACIVGFGVVMVPLIIWAMLERGKHIELMACAFGLAGLSYMIAIGWFSAWSFRRRRELLAEFAAQGITSNAPPAWEYRSRWTLLGLPVVHIRLGGGVPSKRTPVKAWLAAGDLAVGVLLAFGGVAIAPISIGGVAIGLLPFGGLAVGLLALGGFGVGVWTWGGFAAGWQAFGGCALGWNAAFGGVAIARDFALGGFAQATQANNAAAKYFMDTAPFFHYSQSAAKYSFWANLIWVVPLLLCRRAINRGQKQSQQTL